jgi:3-oxoacyl-[acyl-carrier-protein] synthase-1
MIHQPMSIIGLGMISALASGAVFNAAAMQCAYDGFTQTSFVRPGSLEPLIGAPVPEELLGGNFCGLKKLTRMASIAIKEAIESLPANYSGLPVIFCLPDKQPINYFNNDNAIQTIIDDLFQEIGLGEIHPESCALWRHRCGFTSALRMAQAYLYTQKHEYALIVTLDSLLNQASLGHYGGGLYGEKERLLGAKNPDGFIPGEAATAVLLSKPNRHRSEVDIIGVGEADEVATIGHEEEILRGIGLSQAINQAAEDAGINVHDTDFRIGSMSGETYFFSEASYAQFRTLKQKIETHPLWHPATHVGEVGASIGGAIVVMAYYALLEEYAPGPTALCHISNDDERRGAFIMQHKKQES